MLLCQRHIGLWSLWCQQRRRAFYAGFGMRWRHLPMDEIKLPTTQFKQIGSHLVYNPPSQSPVPICACTTGKLLDFSIFLDSDLSMHAYVGHIALECFMMLWQIWAVASYLPSFMTKTLVTSLVLSKLDYCNSVMVGLTKTLTRRLQSIVNAAARLVMRKHKYDHITLILSELHWLGFECRIEFKAFF